MEAGTWKAFSQKKYFVVEGLTLTSAEIREALLNQKAQAFVAHGVAAAFRLFDRVRFDAAIIDHSLYNESIDLCVELRTEGVPYVSCQAPNSWQGWAACKRDAEYAVDKVIGVLGRHPAVVPSNAMSGHPRPA